MRRSFSQRLKQQIAIVVAIFKGGRGVPEEFRCGACGAAARFAGGQPDRSACANPICTNYVPF